MDLVHVIGGKEALFVQQRGHLRGPGFDVEHVQLAFAFEPQFFPGDIHDDSVPFPAFARMPQGRVARITGPEIIGVRAVALEGITEKGLAVDQCLAPFPGYFPGF